MFRQIGLVLPHRNLSLYDSCVGLFSEYVSAPGVARPTAVLPADQQQSDTGIAYLKFRAFDCLLIRHNVRNFRKVRNSVLDDITRGCQTLNMHTGVWNNPEVWHSLDSMTPF